MLAQFAYAPSDPSVVDDVEFFDLSSDPVGVGIATSSWSFGDGTTGTGRYVQHRYAVDGDYEVSHTVTTGDGRRRTCMLVVHVRTHDVAISQLAAPASASVGETRPVTVTVSDIHYPEAVQVQLLKHAGSGWATVGTLTLPVAATTEFAFPYTFTSADASGGEVSFRAVATIPGARVACPSDNDVTAAPTKVKASSLASK